MANLPQQRIDPSGMARLNAVRVLSVFADSARSRTLTALMEATGLARRTTELAVERLVSHGLVIDEGVAEGARNVGRPARSYRFNARAGHVMGISLSAGRAVAHLAGLDGEILRTSEIELDHEAGRAARLDAVAKGAASLLEQAGVSAKRVWAVTAGTPGLVTESKQVGLCQVLPEWSDFNLGKELSTRLGTTVRIANETNLAAIAERWRGSARDVSDLVWVRLGRQVRAAIVVRGRIVNGLDGAAGEIGWLDELGWKALADSPLSRLGSSQADVAASAAALLQAAEDGDASAQSVLDEYITALVPGLSALALVLNPEAIVLGGAGRYFDQQTVARIRDAVAERVVGAVDVRASRLGTDAAALGALRMSFRRARKRLLDPERLA